MKKLLVLLVATTLLIGCQKEEFDPAESFTRIYDSFRSDLEFYPVDVVPTQNGFLVLSGQAFDQENFRTSQVIELDEEGQLVTMWESQNYAVPVGDWISIDSVYYFFAMDPTTLNVFLLKTPPTLTEPTVITVNGLSYPLAAAETAGGNLLLLSYDIDNQESRITELDTGGNILNNASFTIGAGDDVSPEILDHYLDPERHELPFFCGEGPGGQVYFNSFYNYHFSLVFTNFGGADGVVQGQGSNGGITKALPIQGSTYGLFGFQFNDNFINPAAAIPGGLSSSIDFLSTTISEFKSRTRADIEIININETPYVVFAAETENRQVALYFYNAETGEIAGLHKIGYLNPYTLASITKDSEDNLLVLGTTYVSGRFQRIFLTKIPQDDLKGIVD